MAVRFILNAIIRDDRDGILVPVPQYPLYSASIQLYGGPTLPLLSQACAGMQELRIQHGDHLVEDTQSCV